MANVKLKAHICNMRIGHQYIRFARPVANILLYYLHSNLVVQTTIVKILMLHFLLFYFQ